MKAWIKKGKIHFDQEGWDFVLTHARKTHQSPKTTVLRGIRRGIRKMKRESL